MRNRRSPSQPASAFTIIELLVVIAIMALAIGVSYPVLSNMRASSRESSGLNTVSVCAIAARGMATREINFLTDLNPSVAGDQTGSYDGVAIIFTPGGEARLVENDEDAVYTGNNYFELRSPKTNAYKDIEGRDYIILPSGTGIRGIQRNAAGVLGIEYLAPPFAVRYDQNGVLISRASGGNEDGHVYYDADWGGTITLSDDRPANYDHTAWDWRDGGSVNVVTDPSGKYQRRELPFSKIETVVGVVLFDATLPQPNWEPTSAAEASDLDEWIDENGTVLFFSRYAGTVMKEVAE